MRKWVLSYEAGSDGQDVWWVELLVHGCCLASVDHEEDFVVTTLRPHLFKCVSQLWKVNQYRDYSRLIFPPLFAELKVPLAQVFIQGFSFRMVSFSIFCVFVWRIFVVFKGKMIKGSPSIQSQTHCTSVTNLDPGSWGERQRRVRIPDGFKLISGVV